MFSTSIKKKITKLFFKIIDLEKLYEIIDPEKLELKLIQFDSLSKYKNLKIGKNSILYKESIISNLQDNPSNIDVGENTHIRGELLLFGHGGKIVIGNNSYIGPGTRVWSASKIIIGNNVLISHNCNIIDTDSHEIDFLKRALTFQNMIKYGPPKENKNIVSKPIYIEDNVWLSYNVSILKGVRIGFGAIIAAGSMVTKDVEPFTLVAGNPAKFIRRV